MCYYNGIRVSKADYLRLLAIEKEIAKLKFSLNRPVQSGFAYAQWPILKALPGGQDFEVVEAHWEFIAPWCPDWKAVEQGRKKYTTLNAIGETLLESKLYRDAALNRRCLVLSSGFYEWRHHQPEGAKKAGTYPYHIGMADQPLFYMAGVWQPWADKSTGETLDTFAIVTTAANGLMQQIHNTKKRMPLILPDALAAEWLLGKLSGERIKEIAHYQVDSQAMVAWPVAKDFRTADNPVAEAVYAELPPLL
jgi:putative SOS response-associated peptidase YedK